MVRVITDIMIILSVLLIKRHQKWTFLRQPLDVIQISGIITLTLENMFQIHNHCVMCFNSKRFNDHLRRGVGLILNEKYCALDIYLYIYIYIKGGTLIILQILCWSSFSYLIYITFAWCCSSSRISHYHFFFFHFHLC